MRAWGGWFGSVDREESRAEKTALKKRLSPLLTRFAGDGCLKMSNDAAERAIRSIALGGMNYFLLVPTPAAARASKPPPGPSARRRFTAA
ncbi:MAG: IS66 family transposase [Methylocella sp.]